jgi:hypothetical protein
MIHVKYKIVKIIEIYLHFPADGLFVVFVYYF